MQRVPLIQVLEFRVGPLVVHDALYVHESELILLLNDLNQGNLVHQIDVIDWAPKRPQQVYKRYLSINRTVQQRRRSVDIQHVRRQSLLQQVLQSLLRLVVVHLLVGDVGEDLICLLVDFSGSAGVENVLVLVPLAEQVQRRPALAVLHVEVCVDPFHEDF